MKGKEKMENKGTILSYRPDIRVVDATIRDGGLVNDFRFTDEFVKNLYQANIKAGSLTLCLPLDFHNPLHYSPLRLIFLSNFCFFSVLFCTLVV